MGLRDSFGKLSSRLQRSRAPSPAPPASTQQAARKPTPHDAGSVPERLWNQAYDELKNAETNKAIVTAYEKILSEQLKTATISPNNSDVTNIIASDPHERWKQMERLVQVGLERTAKDADKKQKVNQWLEMIKPLRQAIDTGIKAAPEAAIPWAGVCCALEILSSPLTEPTKNRDGMTHVLARMEWYWELSRLLLDESRPHQSSQPLRAQLETRVASLYGKLLLYEMKSVVLYHRSRFGVFLRDLPKLDDWETQLKEIKDAEAAVERDSSQYNTLEMRSALQDISTSASVSETKLHGILLEHKDQGAWHRKDRLEEKDNQCLRDLRITNPLDDKETIIEAKGGLLTESYRWVMESESYQQWAKDNDDRLLWIKGDPGKGKTMLLCGIISELESSAPDSVFYFFCQAGEPRLRTASAVLRGLIWSLARKRPYLISHVRREYDQAGKDVFNDHNAWQALCGIMTAILEEETSNNCVFIIDALDECTVDRVGLIKLVSRLSTTYKSKWIVSSRNWPEIESQLDSVTSKVRLHLELNHASIANAVQKFISRKVEDLANKKRYSQPTRDAVMKHLLLNANDTFLWVALVCEELGKYDVLPHHTSQILESFPPGLDKLYSRMIQEVLKSRDRQICKAILAVVTVTFKPLSLAELAVSDERLTTLVPDVETLSYIVRSCGSFLAIRNDIVYAVHQSVNDFLQTAPEIFPSGLAQQHYSVFLSCMDSMQSNLHRNLYSVHDNSLYLNEISTPPSSPLDIIRYSCIYWVDHLHQSPREAIQGPSTWAGVEALLKTKYLYWLEAMSLLRCVSHAIRAIRQLESGLLETAPKELKVLVEDALRFALTHRVILDTVPLQLYDSALIFSPARSKVRESFEKEMPTHIRVLPSSFQDWDDCLFTLPGMFSSSRGSLCFSPDGGRLATIRKDQKAILILDTLTGEVLRTIESDKGEIFPVAFTPKGTHLVTVSYGSWDAGGDTIMIWDTYTRECVQSFQSLLPHSHIMALSRDQKHLALGWPFGPVHVWNPWTGAFEYSLDLLQGEEGFIHWAHLGITDSSAPCFVSIVSTADSCQVVVQSLEKGDVISTASMSDEANIYEAALDPDCKRLVISTRGDDDSVCVWLWEAQTPSEIRRIIDDGVFSHISDISWAPDGQTLAMVTTEGIILWNVAKQSQVARIPEPVIMARFGTGSSLVSLGEKSLQMWRISSDLNEPVSVHEQKSNRVEELTPGPNEQLGVRRFDGDREISSTATGNKLCQFHTPAAHDMFPAVFGSDHHFAFIDENNLINIWDTESGTCLHRLRGHADDNRQSRIAIKFGPSGQLMSANHEDGKVRIWNSVTGECLRTVGPSYCADQRIIALSVDGHIAIASPRDGIYIWDSGIGEQERALKARGVWIIDFSFSSNGLLAVLSESGRGEMSLAIVDVGQGTCIEKYHLHNVLYAKFDPSSNSRIDVGHGVLDLSLKEVEEVEEEMDHQAHSVHGMPPVWNSQCLRLTYTDTEAWLVRGSKRVLWIPRLMVSPLTFVVRSNFDTGASIVAIGHSSHVLVLRFGESKQTLD